MKRTTSRIFELTENERIAILRFLNGEFGYRGMKEPFGKSHAAMPGIISGIFVQYYGSHKEEVEKWINSITK